MDFLITGTICVRKLKHFQNGSRVEDHSWFGLCLDFMVKWTLNFPSGRINAFIYQDLLEENMLPIAEAFGGHFWIFEQDNASIHTENSTWKSFLNNGMLVIPWPSVFLDLNPM